MGPPNPPVSIAASEPSAERHYRDESSSSSTTPSQLSFAGPDALDVESENLHQHTTLSEKLPWLRPIIRAIPRPVRRVTQRAVDWTKGPDPPRIWKINPFLPKIQTIPTKLLDRYAPKQMQRFWLLIFFYFCFLLCFITVLNKSAFSEDVPGYGSPSTISCTDTLWAYNNGCGVDGNDCRPFENETLAFRCSANCAGVQVLNPRSIGAQVVTYQSLVIGGPNDTADSVNTAFYRGDSFICSAAIHAGFITNEQGGCGVVSVIGQRSNFPSVSQNGIDSIGFDSNFPLAYQFLQETSTSCKDLRWPLLGITITFSVLLSLFTTSPAVFFWSECSGLFFHTALVSDPPTFSNYYDLVSFALGRFLPAAFVLFVVYKYVSKRSLTGLTAQVEKTVFWLGGCYVGIMNNYTFDAIPIQRLTPHDLKQQPGAITALVIIVLVVLAIAVGQIWAIRVEGLLRRYLALYAFMAFCLLMLLAVPDMNLRIHHYILALLLLPGTAMQNRPSLLWQGLLVGLFINGIARWGFDSILQTGAQLQGDALTGSERPNITAPVIAAQNITFNWGIIPDDFDGISVLVNDVERFRGYEYDGPSNFTWTRAAPVGDPEYFRFAFMSGSTSGDYTRAGIWNADTSWTEMADGATK